MKYELICNKCGKNYVKDITGKKQDETLQYHQHYGVCPECWKEEKRKKEKEMGLLFCATVLPFVNEDTGELMIELYFDGNTYDSKELIKSIGGYHWDAIKSGGDFYSAYPKKSWMKWIPAKKERIIKEIEKAESIGAKYVEKTDLFLKAQYEAALEQQKDWKRRHKKI
jgi:hypothetical protein